MSKVIAYSYYEDGLRASMTDPEGNVVDYSYDNAKRLSQVSYNSAIEAQYDYNALGMWTTITSGAVANPAAVTTYTYNSQLWLSAMQHVIPSTGAVISSYGYAYDYVGNRTTMTVGDNTITPTQTITYTYDAIYQLTVVTTTGASTTTVTNTYDGVGNKTSNNNNGAWTYYAHNDANQVISRTSGATTCIMQYDANGNMITETVGASIYAYTYDYENRLTVHNIPGTTSDMVLTYDALSRRITKNVNSGTSIEKYLYDGVNVLGDYNNSNVCIASYVTPFLDHNLIISRSGSVYYYLHDGLGSVRTIVDTASNIQNAYDYAPDGVVKSGAVENISNRYKFTGREHDTQGNMYNYRARMYKPGSGQQGGRFMQRDPIGYGAGTNIYSYCYNNPVNWIDPSGLYAVAGQDNTTAWAGPARPGMNVKVSARPAMIGDKSDMRLMGNKIVGIHTNVESDDPVNLNDTGHSWITIEDIDTGDVITIGLWPSGRTITRTRSQGISVGRMSPYSDVVINKEQDEGYLPRYSRYYGIHTDSQWVKLMKYIMTPATWVLADWTGTNNCSSWASGLIRAVFGEDVDADDEYLFGAETPNELARSIDELERKHPTDGLAIDGYHSDEPNHRGSSKNKTSP